MFWGFVNAVQCALKQALPRCHSSVPYMCGTARRHLSYIRCHLGSKRLSSLICPPHTTCRSPTHLYRRELEAQHAQCLARNAELEQELITERLGAAASGHHADIDGATLGPLQPPAAAAACREGHHQHDQGPWHRGVGGLQPARADALRDSSGGDGLDSNEDEGSAGAVGGRAERGSRDSGPGGLLLLASGAVSVRASGAASVRSSGVRFAVPPQYHTPMKAQQQHKHSVVGSGSPAPTPANKRGTWAQRFLMRQPPERDIRASRDGPLRKSGGGSMVVLASSAKAKGGSRKLQSVVLAGKKVMSLMSPKQKARSTGVGEELRASGQKAGKTKAALNE